MQGQKRTDTVMGNSILGRIEVARNQELHRQRLAATVSSIDTRSPPSQPHLTLYGRDYVTKKKATTEAAFSDLKMIQSIARTMTRSHSLPERMGPISLNSEARKNEIYRIMHENHKLLYKIENVEAFSSTKDLLQKHRDNKRYLINASHAARAAGEYETDIKKDREERRKVEEAQKESVSNRLEKGRRQRKARERVALPTLGNSSGSTSPPLSKGSGGLGRRVGEAEPSKQGVRFATETQDANKARIRPSPTPHPRKQPLSFEMPAEDEDEEGARARAVEALEKACAGEDEEEEGARARAVEALEKATLLDDLADEADAKQDSDPEYAFEKDEGPLATVPKEGADEDDEYKDAFAEETFEKHQAVDETAPAQEDSFESSIEGAGAAATE